MQLSQIKLFRLIHIILLFFILSVQSGSAEEIDVLDFLPAILAGRASCNMDPSQEILVTPYANESDMQEIREVFSTVTSGSLKNRVHDGLDIYPVGDLKPFQAACSGRIEGCILLMIRSPLCWHAILHIYSNTTLNHNLPAQARPSSTI